MATIGTFGLCAAIGLALATLTVRLAEAGTTAGTSVAVAGAHRIVTTQHRDIPPDARARRLGEPRLRSRDWRPEGRRASALASSRAQASKHQ